MVHRPRGTQRGFSLIEVLVTLLLIFLALLALLSLQHQALRLSQSAQWRAQAVALAADLAERMAANPAGSLAGHYTFVCPRIAQPQGTLCSAAGACLPATQAAQDLAQWSAAVAASLPEAACAVRRIQSGQPSRYTIGIDWQDRQADVPVASQGGAAAPALPRQSYQAQRSIFD